MLHTFVANISLHTRTYEGPYYAIFCLKNSKIFLRELVASSKSTAHYTPENKIYLTSQNIFEEDVLNVLNLLPSTPSHEDRNRNKKYTQHNLLFTLYNSNISAINIHHRTKQSETEVNTHTHIHRVRHAMIVCIFPTNSIINHWYFIRHLKRWMICANEISIIYGSIRCRAQERDGTVCFLIYDLFSSYFMCGNV